MKKKKTLITEWFGFIDEAPISLQTPAGQVSPELRSQQVELTVGGKKMKFTAEEFMELADSGQLGELVRTGKVRKLPGV